MASSQGQVPQDARPAATSESPGMWRFESNHDESCIQLSNNGQTATFIDRDYQDWGVIVASQPMEANVLYEVQVDEKDDKYDLYSMRCGALLTPTTPPKLPPTACDWDCAVCFFGVDGSGGVCDRGVDKDDEVIGEKLCNLSVGDRLGVVLDDAGHLHVVINGTAVTSLPGVDTPCFALFQLKCSQYKVTTLPLRRFKRRLSE